MTNQLSAHNATVVDQHNRQAAGYARLTASVANDRAARFRDLVKPLPDDRVLDVCCGPGLQALGLAPYVAEVVGLDITPGMLAEARKMQAGAGATNITWVEGDAAAMPFADASFSLIVCGSAFHHLESPQAVLAEMIRVCRPGGRVSLTDVTPAPDKLEGYNRLEFMRDPSHIHAFSVAELRELGRAAGLGEAEVITNSTGAMSFERVLATSHPEQHTIAEIRALLAEDAKTGADSLGFQAQFIDGELMATYTTSAFVWQRP